ncbi:MAG TPA: ATP-binding cassette domain-containing protein, partial [Acidimicrobiia bacterium]|nr:ATP-binding cassette domain-containing protein [Acidimicrobiia bacterium]
GADIRTEPADVRRRIGLSGQYAAVDEYLTGFENLDLIGRLYHLGRKRAGARAHELLERFSLAEAGKRPVKGYSGGMRRRLDLACALVAEPPILILDEPTTGLDPLSRVQLWGVIRELVAKGSTLLLTTQYMEEADQLADDIVVIDQGREIAHGTSDELKTMVGGERVDITLAEEADLEEAKSVLARTTRTEIHRERYSITAPISGGADTLMLVLRAFSAAGIHLTDVGLRRPTLDDVFLSLTGHIPDAPAEPELVTMGEAS